MAKEKEEQQDLSEKVRGGLLTMVRNLFLLAAVVALGWAVYMIFIGSNPRRQLTTIDETLQAYTAFVDPFVEPAASRPSVTEIADFLSFFDDESKQFFRDNVQALAKQRFQFDPDGFAKLDDNAIRVQAMLNLINRPPLSGVGAIIEQRPTEKENETRVVVHTRTGGRTQILMRKQGTLWVITQLGGIRQNIEQEIKHDKK